MFSLLMIVWKTTTVELGIKSFSSYPYSIIVFIINGAAKHQFISENIPTYDEIYPLGMVLFTLFFARYTSNGDKFRMSVD